MTDKTIENLKQSFTRVFSHKIDIKLIDLFFDTVKEHIYTVEGDEFNRFIDILRLIRFNDINGSTYFQPYQIASIVRCDYNQELLDYFTENHVYNDYIKITICLDYNKLAISILNTFWQKIADQIYWHANDIDLI